MTTPHDARWARRRQVRSKNDTVRLEWTGRSWEPGKNAESRGIVGAPRIFWVERHGAVAGGQPRAPSHAGTLLLGDALAVAAAVGAGRADLVYLDPPYASEADYELEARLDGPADGRARRGHAFGDRWAGARGGIGGYLSELAPRLEAAARLLAPRGTLWVHLDWRAAYLVRVVVEEILGRGSLKNEIVWRRAPNLGRQAASGQFGRTLDTILVFGGPEAVLRVPTRLEPIEPRAIRRDAEGRAFTTAPRGDYTDASIARLEKEGRVHRTPSGKVYVKYFLVPDAEGRLCRERRVDALWDDVAPLRHAPPAERSGWPTQKPLALLDRIVRAATDEGGLVVDAYAGSGTTGVAAARAGRRFALGDVSPAALSVARARLLREGVAFDVGVTADARLPEGPARVKARRSGASVHVTLLDPEEPPAWAVGTEDAEGVFSAAWSSTRTPGTRTVPAAREAVVPAGPAWVVRAWTDAGEVRSARVFA